MPRYVDIEPEIQELQSVLNEHKDDVNSTVYYTFQIVLKKLKSIPTADVAPRAEVDRLERILASYALQYGTVVDKKKVIDEAKAEFAREIFEEIEREINAALQSNYKVLPQIEQSESLWNRVAGKIDALRGIDGFVEELKKKYIGSE